nr:hypothetical protein [Armatimonadota bacterium]
AAINDEGHIAGTSLSFGSNTVRHPSHAVLSIQGHVKDLGALPGGQSSRSSGLNNADEVFGMGMQSNRYDHNFLYSCGQMIDLDPLIGGWSIVAGIGSNIRLLRINNDGTLIGLRYHTLHLAEVFSFRDQKTTILGEIRSTIIPTAGHLPGFGVLCANSRGDLAGWELVPGEGGPSADSVHHATVWARDRKYDLNRSTFLPPGWVLEEASAINERGQIACNAVHGNTWRPFLLTPALRTKT